MGKIENSAKSSCRTNPKPFEFDCCNIDFVINALELKKFNKIHMQK